MRKTFFQAAYDFLCILLRLILLPDKTCERLGLTSLQQERIYNILPHIEGKLLDIGCGNNRLVREYGNGVGVDVYDWGGGATIVESTSNLLFDEGSFDTVTLVASLNHIPERKHLIKEMNRVLKMNGKVIINMINPFLGFVGHKIWWYDEHRTRGMAQGETYGLWNKDVIQMFEENGFKLELHKRFVYWMNNLFIFRKKSNFA